MSANRTPRRPRLSKKAVEGAKHQTQMGGTGYGRPPEEHQFKPGVSGNPKGRPRAMPAESSSKLILEEAKRPVRVQEQGVISEISTTEAVHRSLVQSAVKDRSPYAQKTYLQLLARAEVEQRAVIDEEVEWWTNAVQNLRELHELAKKAGKPPPDILPHPDDVVIEKGKGVRFIGPCDEDEVAKLHETLKVRDLLLVQSAWDRRHGRGEGDADLTVAAVMAHMINNHVPVRYRMSVVESVTRMSRLDGTNKRELRKLLFRGWRALGQHWTVTVRFPSVAEYIKIWERISDGYREAANREAH